MLRASLILVHLALGLAIGTGVQAQAPKAAVPPPKTVVGDETTRHLNIATKPFTGDFDQMLERRMIRVYAPYSRSLYFIDKGRERGLGAELVRDFERWVNQKYAKQLGKRPLTIYIVAATRDKLLSDLNDGVADIAIGNLTVTEERLKVVDFVAPDERLVNIEILVTGPASPTLSTIDDLSGKTVHVRKASSYYTSLMALNERLKKEGSPRSTSSWCPMRSRTRTCWRC
jgi:membrane-bound lytic murein transglycosylase MltF